MPGFKFSGRVSLKILVLRTPVVVLRTPKGYVYPRLRTTVVCKRNNGWKERELI